MNECLAWSGAIGSPSERGIGFCSMPLGHFGNHSDGRFINFTWPSGNQCSFRHHDGRGCERPNNHGGPHATLIALPVSGVAPVMLLDTVSIPKTGVTKECLAWAGIIDDTRAIWFCTLLAGHSGDHVAGSCAQPNKPVHSFDKRLVWPRDWMCRDGACERRAGHEAPHARVIGDVVNYSATIQILHLSHVPLAPARNVDTLQPAREPKCNPGGSKSRLAEADVEGGPFTDGGPWTLGEREAEWFLPKFRSLLRRVSLKSDPASCSYMIAPALKEAMTKAGFLPRIDVLDAEKVRKICAERPLEQKKWWQKGTLPDFDIE